MARVKSKFQSMKIWKYMCYQLFVQAHEKTCGVSQSLRAEGDSRSSAVLSSLGLRPSSNSSSSPSWSATGTTTTTVVRPKPSSYTKFLSIDFTSPLGQYILSLGSVGGSAGSINIESLCTRYVDHTTRYPLLVHNPF